MSNRIEDYLDLPYHLVVTPGEDGYGVAVAELPGCVTFVETWEQIPGSVREAMTSWVGSALKHGDPVPQPAALEVKSQSQKVGAPITIL
jgi:antitoxin HicB